MPSSVSNLAPGRKGAANIRVGWSVETLASLGATSTCETSISYLPAATKFPRRIVGRHKIPLPLFVNKWLRKLYPDVAIRLKFSAIQTSVPTLIGVERCATIICHVAIIAVVHATAAKRERAARSLTSIMESASRNVTDNTRPAGTAAPSNVTPAPSAPYARHPAKCVVVILSAARSAMNLAHRVLSKLARRAVHTHNARCHVLLPATGFPVRKDVRKFWTVDINVHLYVERYAPASSSVKFVALKTSKRSRWISS